MPKSIDADAVVSKRQLATIMGLTSAAIDECTDAPVESGGYRVGEFFRWYVNTKGIRHEIAA